MPLIEATELSVEAAISATLAAISSVALAVWPARFFTSAATTAKPRPASPARAASMVALSARRLVWLAISEISPTIWPMLPAAAARRRTSAAIASASRVAEAERSAEAVAWVPISRTEAESSSVAAATVSAERAASCEALATWRLSEVVSSAAWAIPSAAAWSWVAAAETVSTMPPTCASKPSARLSTARRWAAAVSAPSRSCSARWARPSATLSRKVAAASEMARTSRGPPWGIATSSSPRPIAPSTCDIRTSGRAMALPSPKASAPEIRKVARPASVQMVRARSASARTACAAATRSALRRSSTPFSPSMRWVESLNQSGASRNDSVSPGRVPSASLRRRATSRAASVASAASRRAPCAALAPARNRVAKVAWFAERAAKRPSPARSRLPAAKAAEAVARSWPAASFMARKAA
ncbi:hypothetical protein IFDJLNFL_1945 [Methylobacterium dankookense]|uniref:Uncharacterized protein n=1 Tax=Methylobacterium dankookense TaxID=560405 RepID=A0ABQ4RE73_9HYPH|nr:hypothetical protein IFDJLNFL_1945 [Methylobacterium dankookense]